MRPMVREGERTEISWLGKQPNFGTRWSASRSSQGEHFLFGLPRTRNALSPFCPSVLPVKSCSCEVACVRHGSFCDSGCSLAATYWCFAIWGRFLAPAAVWVGRTGGGQHEECDCRYFGVSGGSGWLGGLCGAPHGGAQRRGAGQSNIGGRGAQLDERLA